MHRCSLSLSLSLSITHTHIHTLFFTLWYTLHSCTYAFSLLSHSLTLPLLQVYVCLSVCHSINTRPPLVLCTLTTRQIALGVITTQVPHTHTREVSCTECARMHAYITYMQGRMPEHNHNITQAHGNVHPRIWKPTSMRCLAQTRDSSSSRRGRARDCGRRPAALCFRTHGQSIDV